MNLVWDLLLPAMRQEALAEERASQPRLAEKLSGLTLPPVRGRTTSPMASQVAGRTYRIDGNELQLETIALQVSETGWRVNFTTAAGEETIPCGYGVWQHGQTSLFHNPWMLSPTPIVASGAWTTEESFTMVARLYETPFYHTLVYHFIGEELLVETRVNVSLESTKPLWLSAHLA